jgi:hypothetical protein
MANTPAEAPHGTPAMLAGRARAAAPPAAMREVQAVHAPRGELPATMPPTVYNQPLSRTLATGGAVSSQRGNVDLARQPAPTSSGERAAFPQAPADRTYPYRDSQNSGANPDAQIERAQQQERQQQQAEQQREMNTARQQQAQQQRQSQEPSQQREMQQQAQQREVQQQMQQWQAPQPQHETQQHAPQGGGHPQSHGGEHPAGGHPGSNRRH